MQYLVYNLQTLAFFTFFTVILSYCLISLYCFPQHQLSIRRNNNPPFNTIPSSTTTSPSLSFYFKQTIDLNSITIKQSATSPLSHKQIIQQINRRRNHFLLFLLRSSHQPHPHQILVFHRQVERGLLRSRRPRSWPPSTGRNSFQHSDWLIRFRSKNGSIVFRVLVTAQKIVHLTENLLDASRLVMSVGLFIPVRNVVFAEIERR